MLFAIPTFAETVLTTNWQDLYTLTSRDAQLFNALKQGLHALHTGQTWIPFEFTEIFQFTNGAPICTHRQEDAHEFLSALLSGLARSLKNTDQKHLIQDLLQSSLTISLVCPNCGEISSHAEEQLWLSLEVQGVDDLNASLQQYIENEKIEGISGIPFFLTYRLLLP